MALLCCGGGTPKDSDPEVEKANKELNDKIAAEAAADKAEIKLLLLGAGESGKSTVFKQMKIINEAGYTDEEKKTFKSVVHSNTIQSMKALLEGCDKLEITYGVNDSAQAVMALGLNDELSEETGEHVKKCWADGGVQAGFLRANEFQLNDSAKYYFDVLDRICASDYMPTEQDVLRSRVRTTGIVESKFEISGVFFRMFDVGGQRNERRKWIHCFDNVTAVIFVASMSEYDQNLYEDENQNRMIEALNLFDQICNSRWFMETSMILFLNKRDLFEMKIARVDMTCLWPEYTGGLDYEAGRDFIEAKFMEQNKVENKSIFAHCTCATDTGNVRFVWTAIKEIVLQGNLKESGF